MRAVLGVLILLLAGVGVGAAFFESAHERAIDAEAAQFTGGNPKHGRELVRQYGCVACHDIPGFPGTTAHVGPPLEKLALRAYIAGVAENQPANLKHFLIDPRAVVPRSAMPNLHVTQADARDLAAFLYTLQ